MEGSQVFHSLMSGLLALGASSATSRDRNEGRSTSLRLEARAGVARPETELGYPKAGHVYSKFGKTDNGAQTGRSGLNRPLEQAYAS